MNKQAVNLEDLLADGFTERFAREYLMLLERERSSNLFDPDYLAWAHEHGFLAESACAYGLDDDNLESYLSDYDYWKLWPLNDWQRIWINDKLTLHALMQDSDLASYLPAYFYYSKPHGVLPLADSLYAPGIEGLIETLRREGTFACKPCNGTEATGFHKLAYREGFSIDGERTEEAGIRAFVEQHPNYVFTEFIKPEASLAAINPLIHTLRILVLNPTGADPVPVLAYLRFAIEDGESGNGSNYRIPSEADISDFNVRVNLETGAYDKGKLVFINRVVDSPRHPTSGVLVEGTIPHWDKLLEMIRRISLKVGACEYLGFDACLTDKGPKIMEINSHSGIKYLQLYSPIMEDKTAASYYRAKLAEIDALDEAGKRRRNGVIR
ncbi:sugar-transfer associated ATP-grasp domain-containing protein [Gordonibacter massiliensis (ex Traore et al. 2017)]|uniref:sugar-transfer associated ATP-grasp domain-containing protein n=1 Tax=Gordonibacter massiliensis (ex Traore et al. 2017) TaxID=1841863 RepID=UPI001C8CE736|nr:sugar-transfer associated ATP-grasp domain-containing protein [Gordonibacter massiliensis (ex Traore et al. 2017)]MBX9033631.1 hypothetical protein [Gordonibacter massiliensis (ex Traore et al. 2017)]